MSCGSLKKRIATMIRRLMNLLQRHIKIGDASAEGKVVISDVGHTNSSNILFPSGTVS